MNSAQRLQKISLVTKSNLEIALSAFMKRNDIPVSSFKICQLAELITKLYGDNEVKTYQEICESQHSALRIALECLTSLNLSQQTDDREIKTEISIALEKINSILYPGSDHQTNHGNAD